VFQIREKRLTVLLWRRAEPPFAGSWALPGGLLLADSYHCSRYNTNTGRLTPAMFEAVLAELRRRFDDQGKAA